MKRIFHSSRRVLILIFCLFTFQFYNCVQAQEWLELYSNTRAMGMGGANLAVASDETALYRNPAQLGSVRDFYGTFLDPEIEGSSNFVDQVSSKFTSKAFDIATVKTILDSNRGEYYHAKFQVTPSVVRRHIGLGFIYKNQIHAEMNSLGTSMDLTSHSDIGAVFGLNVPLFGGRIKIGANAKAISRIEISSSDLSTAGPFDLPTIASEGMGVSIDAGIMLQAPWVLMPTLSVVARDIGDTKFEQSPGLRLKTNSRPKAVKQSVDAAIAIFPIHANNYRSSWTLEYVDITNSREDTDNLKRVKFGLETNWRDALFVRLGMHQRYWTAGFEVASERMSWQIASYGEEIGTTTNGVFTPKQDRRLSMKFAVRF